MKFVYITDLHGHVEKYETVLKYAIEHKIKLLHIGADILPKGANMQKKQKKFIKGYLKNFYAECKRNGIRVLAFFGNDDLYTRKHQFGEYGDLLDKLPYRKNGYTFKAYGYVPDHCFGLKNGTKLDRYDLKPVKLRPYMVPTPVFGTDDWQVKPVLRDIPVTPRPVDIHSNGINEIEDLEEYFKRKGTIEDDLKSIRVGSKTIMALHAPPAGCNLDVCSDGKGKAGEAAGSEAILRWILKKQPLLVLCGHIHENFRVTRSWRTVVGRTAVIQPGQHYIWEEGEEKKTTFVVIEITDCKVKAERFEI